MKIWKVNYSYGDGCTYWGTDCVSIHKSEEGAALAIDKHKEALDTGIRIPTKLYPVDENRSFEIEEAVLED